jgi:hypothetical protein
MIRHQLHLGDEINTKAGREFYDRKTEKFFDACQKCGGTCAVTDEGRLASCPDCSLYAGRIQAFSNKFFFTVPPLFHNCIWSELQPSVKSILPFEAQKKHMDYLSRHSDESVAFFGHPGTGKSTWMTAMYAQMLWWETTQPLQNTGGLVYRMDCKVLLDQFTQYSLHGADSDPAPAPRLSRERIDGIGRKEGRVRLFLEEIDKVKPTDARMANLYEVVNAIYENKGQLVITSNLTPDQFQQQFGDVFYRRIVEMSRIINLWEEK